MGFTEGFEKYKKACSDAEDKRIAEEKSKAQANQKFRESANKLGDEVVLGLLEKFVEGANSIGYSSWSKFEIENDSTVTWSVGIVPIKGQQPIPSPHVDLNVCSATFILSKSTVSEFNLKAQWILFAKYKETTTSFNNMSDISKAFIDDNLTAFTDAAFIERDSLGR